MKHFLYSVTLFCVFYDVVQGYDANKSKWEQYLKKEKSLDSENAFKNIVSDIVKSNSKTKEPFFNNNLESDHLAAVSNQDISNAKCTSYPGKVVCQIGGYTFLINDSGEKLDTDTLERFTAMVYHRMMKDDSNFEIGINPANREVYSFVDKSMLSNVQPSYIECKPMCAGPLNPGPAFHGNLGSPDTTFECEWKDNDKKMFVNIGEKGDVLTGNLILPHYQKETNFLKKRKRQIKMNLPEMTKDLSKINGYQKIKIENTNSNNENIANLKIDKATDNSEEKYLNPGLNSDINEEEPFDLTKGEIGYKPMNNKNEETLLKEENNKRRFGKREVGKTRIWNRLVPSDCKQKRSEASEEQLALYGREPLMTKDMEAQSLSNQEQPANERQDQPSIDGREQISGSDGVKPDSCNALLTRDVGRESELTDEENKLSRSQDEEDEAYDRAQEGAGESEGRAARQCCPTTTTCPKLVPACCPPQTTPICCPPQTKAPCPRCRRQECCPSTTKCPTARTTVCCPSPKMPICCPPSPPKPCCP